MINAEVHEDSIIGDYYGQPFNIDLYRKEDRLGMLTRDEAEEVINHLTGIKKGDKFRINETICEDKDLLDWYDGQEDKVLVANNVELESWGVWTENCPYRIDLSEINVLQ